MANAKDKRMNRNPHIGTMGWSYNFWKGNFYPSDLASEDFLIYYARRFDSVEVDSTFYRIPREQTITDWKEKTPKGFVFSLKFPQKITHVKMLQDCQDETNVFLERVSLLEEKLCVLLLQFPPMFRQQHLPLLRDYLKNLPKGQRYAVEVRNKSLLNEELYELLREHGVALAWVDAAKMPLEDQTTADFVYVRWEGDRKAVKGILGRTEVDRAHQINEWSLRLEPLLGTGTEIYGYFSKYYSGNPTLDAANLLKNLKT